MTIFQKIIDREIPADIVYETDDVLAFRDIQPVAPVHVLVIPKRPLVRLAAASAEDETLLGKLMTACRIVAEQQGIAEAGYRVVTNNGDWGGQSVDHLHLHVIGGRQLTWPPG
ncbi:MAG: histidine triad nucleotide-binding protein [Proteobacteria bacterium]|nr:histidine triad nucleotide-binding protein [Pseudomonadota bacterium]